MVEAFPDAFLVTLITRVVIAAAFRKVSLRNVRAFEVVTVLIAGVSELFRAFLVTGTAKRARDRQRDPGLYIGERGLHAQVRAIRFRRGREINGGVRQRNPRLGHADELN